MEPIAEALRNIGANHTLLSSQLSAATTKRDELILACHRAGMHLRQIASLAGVHYTRVRQIIALHSDDPPLPDALVLPTPILDEWRLARPAEVFSIMYNQGIVDYRQVPHAQLEEMLEQARTYQVDQRHSKGEWIRSMAMSVLYRAVNSRHSLHLIPIVMTYRDMVLAEQWRIENFGTDSEAPARAVFKDVFCRLVVELVDDGHDLPDWVKEQLDIPR